MKFTEERLEQAIIELLEKEAFPHVLGQDIAREPNEVLIKEDLKGYLAQQYANENITTGGSIRYRLTPPDFSARISLSVAIRKNVSNTPIMTDMGITNTRK